MQGDLRAYKVVGRAGLGDGWAALGAQSGMCRGEWGPSIVAEELPGRSWGGRSGVAQEILRHYAGPIVLHGGKSGLPLARARSGSEFRQARVDDSAERGGTTRFTRTTCAHDLRARFVLSRRPAIRVALNHSHAEPSP